MDAAIARQRSGKHFSATTNKPATIEESLEVVFSMRSSPRLYNEDTSRVESALAKFCPARASSKFTELNWSGSGD
jgi:hypothetical protein